MNNYRGGYGPGGYLCSLLAAITSSIDIGALEAEEPFYHGLAGGARFCRIDALARVVSRLYQKLGHAAGCGLID
jgi:hypothetical protein